MRNALLAAAAVIALAAPAAASAETAADFNLFVLKDMQVSSSDTEGRVAVGGNATLTSYSVGFPHASASDVNLVVGGDLTATNGSTVGETIVGGTSSFTGWSTAGLQPSGTPLPVDFAAEGARLTALSGLLDGYADVGTLSFNDPACASRNCQTTFQSATSGLNVFHLDGAKASNTNTFNFNLAPGAMVLVNVSGSFGHIFDAGIFVNGVQIDNWNNGVASQILWNFADAEDLSFHGIAMIGSVLAPNADYLGGWGSLNGQLVVKNFYDTNGATQINRVDFGGGLLSVPEPTTWALMIAGFGMAGATLRRRRRALAL